MSYRFVDSCRAGPGWFLPGPAWKLLSAQWINSRWWIDEVSETCRVPWQNKICEISASSSFYYKETHTILTRQASVPPADLEPAVPASEQPQTHALDSAFTGICYKVYELRFSPIIITPALLLSRTDNTTWKINLARRATKYWSILFWPVKYVFGYQILKLFSTHVCGLYTGLCVRVMNCRSL
jgi:hypothetical protein